MGFLVRGKFTCRRKSPSPLPKPFYYLMTQLCWDLSLEGLEPIKKFTEQDGHCDSLVSLGRRLLFLSIIPSHSLPTEDRQTSLLINPTSIVASTDPKTF